MTKPRIGKIAVTTITKQILSGNPKRKCFTIYNNGDKTVELLSSQHGKYGDGIPIAAASSYPVEHYCQGSYWIVAASGTQDVRIHEELAE